MSKQFSAFSIYRDGGMPLCKLSEIFCSLVVSRVSYCVSAWGGFLNAEQTGKINALFKRAIEVMVLQNTLMILMVL